MRRHKDQCHDQQMFDCPECGQMCDSALDVKRHYDTQHKMEPARHKEVCKHWRRGHCIKGDQCNFAHVGHQQSRESRITREKTTRVPACKHGSNCDWLKRGVCSYFHRGVGVQKPWEERQSGRNQSNSWRQPERPDYRSERRSERSNNSQGEGERSNNSRGGGERSNHGSEGASERSHNCPCVNSVEDFPTFRGERQAFQQRHNQDRRRN